MKWTAPHHFRGYFTGHFSWTYGNSISSISALRSAGLHAAQTSDEAGGGDPTLCRTVCHGGLLPPRHAGSVTGFGRVPGVGANKVRMRILVKRARTKGHNLCHF